MKRWARVDPFLPASKQVIKYLRSKGYKVPLNKKTKRDSADEDGLERLIHDHPTDAILPMVLEIRRLQKALTYLDDEHVGKDGKFHTVFSNHPKTGRLALKRPNLSNVPQGRKQAEVMAAKVIRSTIVPSPGYVFVEADWTGVEALLVGFFAGDPEYIRLARLGVHDNLVSHVEGQPADLSLPDSDLRKYLALMKKTYPETRILAKQTVHAYSYGESEYAIAKTFEPRFLEGALLHVGQKTSSLDHKFEGQVARKAFSLARAAAKTYISAYEKMAPRVKEWQRATRLRAHKEGILKNPFGWALPFFDVLTPRRDSNGEWKRDASGNRMLYPGEEANEALAFLPQSSGAGMLRSTLLELDRNAPGFVLPLVSIHDSILFEVEVGQLEEGISYIRRVMERPFPELDGLFCGCEIKVGKAWSEMEVVA